MRAKSAGFSNLRYTRHECASAGCSAPLACDIDTEGVGVTKQAVLPCEVENAKQIVPYMPRAKNGVGRRYKKRRTSPASTIEVEQIEEEGVEELVVVEGETEEVAEIAIVEFGEDVVMWVLDHVFEKVWAERDWQAYRFVRYATMSSVVVREWKREGGVEGIGPHWWAVRKMWDEFRLAGGEKEYTACAPFGQWESACGAAIVGGLPRSANALESVRAEMFRSGVGALSAGSVLMLTRLVWCAKRKQF